MSDQPYSPALACDQEEAIATFAPTPTDSIWSASGAFAASHDGAVLTVRGPLQTGRYALTWCTLDGSFDMDTAMISLTEWPTMQTVRCGPFDLDHTTNRMAVPTFWLTVDGEHAGLGWCEVPSVADVGAGRIRAECGFAVKTAGEVVITLTVADEDVGRLDWAALAELTLMPDDRYSLPLPAHIHAPSLFAADALFARLRHRPDARESAMLARARAAADEMRDGTYDYLTTTLALLACVDEDEGRLEQARERVRALCAREQWGYHDVPEIMGWNNDRDCGDRMLECALVLNWLGDRLPADEVAVLVAKLRYHAEAVMRMTTVQKGYWYYRACEAHGQGLMCGLLAAAAALLPYVDEARGWLEWALGNLDDALAHLPPDGIVEWPVFNARWHLIALALAESVLGRPLRQASYPAIDNLACNILGFEQAERHSMLGTMLLCLARRSRSATDQADALRALNLLDPEPATTGRASPFALLFYDRSLTPATPRPIPRTARSLGGSVRCHADNGAAFTFQCGSPLTRDLHTEHNWIAQTWYGPARSGSFLWSVAGSGVLAPAALKGYRMRTGDANLITVDDAGHHCHGRWLNGRIPLSWLSEIEEAQLDDGELSWCRANLAPAYDDIAGVVSYRRTWAFDHGRGVVLMLDDIQLLARRQLAWRMHAVHAEWHAEGDRCYVAAEPNGTLTVQALAAVADDAGDVVCERQQPEWVPSYTFGVNAYCSDAWQPEFNHAEPNVPPHHRLLIRPAAPTQHWRLLTAIGVDRAAVRAVTGKLTPTGAVAALADGRGLSCERGQWKML
jgi:hypothetical protein